MDEETELTYNVPEDVSEQQQKEGDEFDDAEPEGLVHDSEESDLENEEQEVDIPQTVSDQPISLVKKTPKKSPAKGRRKKVTVCTVPEIIPPASSSSPISVVTTQAAPPSVISQQGQASTSSTQPAQPVAGAASTATPRPRLRYEYVGGQNTPRNTVIVNNPSTNPLTIVPAPTLAPTVRQPVGLPLANIGSAPATVLNHQQVLRQFGSIGHIVRPDGTLVSIQAPPPSTVVGPTPLLVGQNPVMATSAVPPLTVTTPLVLMPSSSPISLAIPHKDSPTDKQDKSNQDPG